MEFKELGEFMAAIPIVFYAIYILYRRIKNKGNGCSNCGSCSKMCPRYKNKKDIK